IHLQHSTFEHVTEDNCLHSFFHGLLDSRTVLFVDHGVDHAVCLRDSLVRKKRAGKMCYLL
ncbi:hypothetical protein WUBG_12373, partial [Wuchereria bancrofti]